MGATTTEVNRIEADEAVWDVVMTSFERHTEYAEENLQADADLEAELGIDSVSLASILTDVYEACGIAKRDIPAGLSSITQVVRHVYQRLSDEGKSVYADSLQHTAEGLLSEGDAVISRVLTVFRHHTGYGSAELKMEADIEGELGIDSITYASITADLAKVAGLENPADFPGDSVTIHDVVEHLRTLLDGHPLPDQPALYDNDVAVPDDAYLESPQPSHTFESTTDPVDYDDRTMRDFVGLVDRDLFHKTREFSRFYRHKQKSEQYWYGMALESTCRNRAVIYDEVAGKSREFLMFASNNYLGLANHPQVVEAIADAARAYGSTNTGCRLIGGTNVLHKELERRLAEWKGRESCIVYPSGYSANLGCISALAGPSDLVFTDAINHMSIQDGCKLSGAGRRIYQHTMESLEETLEKSREHQGGKLIVTDGVFSMHGDIVNLPRLVELAKAYEAKVLIDDAHSTGVLGRTGSGTTEHFFLKGQVDLELGTMSKALAGVGGFVCGDEAVVEYLRFYSNSYVFAATIPAPVAAGVIASIDVMQAEPQRLSQLWRNIHHLRSMLQQAGFDLEQSASAIIPVVVGSDQVTLELGRAVRARGMYCQTVVFPGVAVGDARLRISVTSEHTTEDLDLAAEILVDAAQEVGVPVAA